VGIVPRIPTVGLLDRETVFGLHKSKLVKLDGIASMLLTGILGFEMMHVPNNLG
jgi:hypothetical protein